MNRLAHACARNAVTRWSLAVTAAILVAGALPPVPEVPSFDLPLRLAAVAASLVPSLALLVIARLTWLAPGAPWARIAPALLTFATAGALAGAMRGWAASALGIDLVVGAGWRVPAMAVAAATWLALMAIAVDFVRSHRATMSSLREQEEVLRHLEFDMHAHLERQRSELLAPAQRVLDRIIAALAGVGGTDDRDAVEEADVIRRMVAGQLRPLSHDMLMGDIAVQAPTPPPMARSDWLSRLARGSAHRITHHPVVASTVPVALFPLVMGPRWGVAFLVVNAVSTWLLLVAMLSIFRRVMQPPLVRMPTVTAAVIVVGGYAFAAVASVALSVLIESLMLTSRASTPAGLAFAAVVIVVMFLGASIVEAAARMLNDDEDAHRATVSQVGWSLAMMRQQARFEQQRIGRRLHGDVQGALLGAARDLEALPPDAPPDVRHAAMQEAAEGLRAAATLLESPPPDDQALDDALGGILLLSRRALDVEVDIDPRTAAIIDSSPATRRVVVDVVAESLTNALRHGGAGAARLTASCERPDVLALEVWDDGTWCPPAGGRTGAGTALYGEVSPDWTLAAVPGGGTRLRVAIPIVPAAPTTPPPS